MSTMDSSMLVYSEKMKRISRQRLAQASSMSPLPSKDKKVLVQGARENPSFLKSEGKNVRQVRSFSDASKYKSLRDKHHQKVTKKHSLDMICSELLLDGVVVKTDSKSQQDSDMISSAWEAPNCVYKRQRRRGVTSMPALQSMNMNENPLYAPETSLVDILPRVGKILNDDLPSSDSDNRGHGMGRVRDDCCSSDGFTTTVLHNADESHEGIAESDFEESEQNNNRKNPSQISQMVLESFSRDSSDLSVEIPGRFKDTSAAELKLLARRKHRLSSSSVPSSPSGSADEDDYYSSTGRRRTLSETIHNQPKPLRSVLKKRSSFNKKQEPLEKRKTVTFISPDTIRVISRCSSYETDTSPEDGVCQSQNTIVVVRD